MPTVRIQDCTVFFQTWFPKPASVLTNWRERNAFSSRGPITLFEAAYSAYAPVGMADASRRADAQIDISQVERRQDSVLPRRSMALGATARSLSEFWDVALTAVAQISASAEVRYRELTRKDFVEGLSAEEREELRRIELKLDAEDEADAELQRVARNTTAGYEELSHEFRQINAILDRLIKA